MYVRPLSLQPFFMFLEYWAFHNIILKSWSYENVYKFLPETNT